jgi:pimeloyl-ACP methyl ester carboxylesterase
MIRRRHVFHIAGYDPIGVARQHRSCGRQIKTFAKTWNVTATVSDLDRPPHGFNPSWTIDTHAGNWQVETTYEPLSWDDIVLADLTRPMAARLAGSAAAFFDFVRSGTLFRYFAANWKYGLFFLFPYLFQCLFIAIGFAIGGWTASHFQLAGALWLGVSAAIGAAIFLGLLQWPGRRWRVLQALDDWLFSWEYVRGRRPDMEARLDSFAERLVARAREASLDEIVVVGHSMGATLAIEVVARALARDPELGQGGPSVCVLTLGSTIPKFTLHPAGGGIRRSAAAVATEPSIAWAEYHARDDAISFYKFDPITESRLERDRLTSKPWIRRVQFHDMLGPQTFRRNRWKFMRLHYQFVMANELRSIYDYYMMVCGPLPFVRSVLVPGGPTQLIARDGALIDVAPVVPAIAA